VSGDLRKRRPCRSATVTYRRRVCIALCDLRFSSAALLLLSLFVLFVISFVAPAMPICIYLIGFMCSVDLYHAILCYTYHFGILFDCQPLLSTIIAVHWNAFASSMLVSTVQSSLQSSLHAYINLITCHNTQNGFCGSTRRLHHRAGQPTRTIPTNGRRT
jgi:hypothetical protein